MTSETFHEYPTPPARPTPLVRVRSTIVTSGLTALRERGLFDRWAAAIDPISRDTLVTTIAGVWLPVDLVMTHYRACDSLGLTHDEVVAIGMSVATRVQDNVLHLLRRLATGAGVTPWVAASQYHQLWARSFDGGGFRITKIGPKDGVIEVFQMPVAEVPYFRSAYCGVSLAGVNLFCTKAYIRVVKQSPLGFSVRMSWV